VKYAKLKLSTYLIRDDYKELLDLIIIFLGEVPPGGIKFKKPGAYHHARWMTERHLLSQNVFISTSLS
jgi:hypothetical protein